MECWRIKLEESVVGEAFCCGWRGRHRWWRSRWDPMFGLCIPFFFPSFLKVCFVKMGLVRWATVSAVKIIFCPF